jgi:TolB-like protein
VRFFSVYAAAQSASTIPEKSITVLPFENRSEDKANAYFADGIQDEILTRLIQDCRSEGHLAHLDAALQKRA